MSDVEEELVRLPQSLAGSQMSLPQSILTNQNSQTFVQTIKHTSSTPVHLNMNLQKEDGTLLEIRPTMTSPIKSPNPIPVTENNDNNNNNRHNLQKEPTFLTQPDSEYGYSTSPSQFGEELDRAKTRTIDGCLKGCFGVVYEI